VEPAIVSSGVIRFGLVVDERGIKVDVRTCCVGGAYNSPHVVTLAMIASHTRRWSSTVTRSKRNPKSAKRNARPKSSPPAKTKAKRATAKPVSRPRRRPKRLPANKQRPIEANVLIHEPIQPIDRGERYEDPVFEALESAGLGGPGDGAGSLCSKEGEIEEVDFDVQLGSLDAIPVVIRVLQERGAPKGSVLRYRHKRKAVEVRFGVTEGVAIYLDGVTQPREVYATTSAQELLDKLLAALDGTAEFRGSWQGPRETSLYFYGDDAEHIFAKVVPVLREYPLSRNARVIVRHGSKANRPREVQLGAGSS
jgi:hypothetical protein